MRHYNIILFNILFLSLQCLAACSASSDVNEKIETGAEQISRYLPLLKDKSIGIVANHTSVIGKTHLVDTLISLHAHVKKIFSPEHGFRGEAGAGDVIDHTLDNKTGIPVISLYGSREKPTRDDLKDIDLIIYDIQDVGVRFYTYISTMHYVMQACAESGIPVIILDRPNPLGYYIDGPVLDTAFKSFVGMHPIPVVYGMTAGELALMINGEGWLGNNLECNLSVISCNNYNHNTYYQLPVHPSPNLKSMEAIYLYPSLCFFEGTIMSVGRGTSFPFRVVGHPDYPDTAFSFVPTPSPANKNPLYSGKICYGIDLRNLDTLELKQLKKLDLKWMMQVKQTMNLGQSFFTGYFNTLAGTNVLLKQLLEELPEQQIRQSWQHDLEIFREKRRKYLLYDDFN